MYEVMVVDDEINILEGIATMVDWQSCGTCLASKAYNGQMAFDIIQQTPPDIIVTDIKMPGLNGIELIEKVHSYFPNIRFIVLSGYDEFTFAKTAMKCGVKHYLLKPSNEKKIEEAIKEVVADLDMNSENEAFIESIRTKLNKVIPKAKEQFLREFIINRKYNIKEWTYYQELFGLEKESGPFRLIGCVIDNDFEYEHLFTLKEIMNKQLADSQNILLSTIISERIVLLVENSEVEEVIEQVKIVKKEWKSLTGDSFTTAVSGKSDLANLHLLYQEILEGLTYRFYLGRGGIVTSEDIQNEDNRPKGFSFDHENLLLAIRSGNKKETAAYLEHFFEELKKTRLDIQVVRTHCLELFMSFIRQTRTEVMEEMFQYVHRFHTSSTLQDIETFIKQIAIEIAEVNYDAKRETQNQLVNQVIDYAKKHLEEESLSLSSIASDVFYMNSDYLGKLFKKETGQKFSTYLMEERMKTAITLIEQSEEVKMFEVAESVGFGNNPRYFSQVFKKHTGSTPTDYKKALYLN
ncbi:two-component system response regulator YesN [Salibacterium salarium]|uniref:response regulator transcription factor n=1 Tax=Salibacterium salarium TaxID=284579 RepID=UPI002785ACDF|nr:response regulator [Salibacterium salarium]MDQ0300189.1 two-component system response regulator YesN [Salibacterium salarium]